MKKKILFFCPSIEDGGVEKNLINIVNNLSNNFNIILLTANFNKKKLFVSNIDFVSPKNTFFNNKSRLLKSLCCIYLFIKNFANKKIIIISFQANVLSIILAKLFNKKIIIRSNASPNYYAKNKLKKKFMSFIFRLADKVIVNCDEFKKEFYRFFKVMPIKIYNPLEHKKKFLKLYNTSLNYDFFDENKKFLKILSIGRLVDQKDHITILKALNLIKKKKKFKFCLIGKGSLKNKLQNFIKKNKINNKIQLVGFKKNVYPYLKKADLFVLSSKFEGLPNTLIESKFTGIQIISTNCKTGPKEILKNYKNKNFFKVGDYSKLAKLIAGIKKKKKKFVFDKRFDFNKNINLYRKVLRNI